MKLLRKTYQDSIYEYIRKMNPSWFNEMESKLRKFCERFESEIKREAEYDGDDRLADPEFLYERFKDNVERGMFNGNWQVLKYFTRLLKLKIYREALGVWSFTEEDKEMYEYFKTVEVNSISKCKQKMLKFESGTEHDNPTIDDDAWYKRYIIYVELDTDELNNVRNTFYLEFIDRRILLVQDIISNCCMKTRSYNDDLFETENPFKSRIIDSLEKVKRISVEPIKTNYEKKQESNNYSNDFWKLVEAEASKNQEYLELKDKITKMFNEIILKTIQTNHSEYERLSPEDRLAVQKIINQ